ncbi:m021L [Myxoma virus]|uniref:M021L n=1 Tax=Myxoma virus TaxID=10273 RepID=A0A4P8ETT5_9POXV|nr:m021L [Myxoma virus]QDP38487.1 m021 [Myxoma virus]
MIKLLGLLHDTKKEVVVHTLKEHPRAVVLTKTRHGKGVVVYAGNLEDVKSMVSVSELDVVGVTPHAEPVSLPASPINSLCIHETDTDVYYFPKTCKSPLLDILKKRFKHDPLIRTLQERDYTVSEINYWLYCNGLEAYRFVNYKDEKANDSQYTLIDDMIISYIGNHYIWVKKKEAYQRPEIDVYPYDLERLSSPSNWTELRPNKQYLKFITILVNATITPNGASVYMITTHPGRCFTSFDPKKLVMDFLRWIRESMVNTSTVVIIGYLSSVFDFPLLKSSWPKDSGWFFVGNNHIVSSDGMKLVLIDAAKFVRDMSIMDYLQHWKSRAVSIQGDMITNEEARTKLKVLEKNSSRVAESLYNATCTQLITLNDVLSPWNALYFTRLDDAVWTASIYEASKSNVYYPSGHEAMSFIRQAIRSSYVDTLYIDVPKHYSVYALKSVFDVVCEGVYPAGAPTYVSGYFDEDKPYIALCEVTVKPDVKIPVLWTNEDTHTFYTALTSVDIRSANRLGGYKIKQIGALVWNESYSLRDVAIHRFNGIHRLNDKKTDYVDYCDRLFPCTDDTMLIFYAFCASYCRRKLHNLIRTIDSHYLGEYVIKHNYKEIWTRDVVKLSDEFLSNVVKLR